MRRGCALANQAVQRLPQDPAWRERLEAARSTAAAVHGNEVLDTWEGAFDAPVDR